MKLNQIHPQIVIADSIEYLFKNNSDVQLIVVDVKSCDINSLIGKRTHSSKDIQSKSSITEQLTNFYLSKFIGTSEFQLSINQYGKPYLQNSQIQFNISHSADKYAIAITDNILVGVDIEQINLSKRVLKIAKRFFSPNEYEFLSSLGDDDIIPAFYDMWTFKESLVKCLGSQMFKNMEKIDFIQKEWKKDSSNIFSGINELFYTPLQINKSFKSTICFNQMIDTITIYYQY